MRKDKKALTSLIAPALTLILLGGSLALSQDDITEEFDDTLDVLSHMSEKISVDTLSLKNFRCLESITIEVTDKKTNAPQHYVYSSQYEVTRKLKPKSSEHIGYNETRNPGSGESTQPELVSFPLIDKPFTGEVIKTFAFENRLFNNYKKLRDETIAGQKCLVVGFTTAKDSSTLSLLLQGASIPLRQQGMIWVDEKSLELVRLAATLKKVPKGIQAYDYVVEFKPQRLFGRSMALSYQIEIHSETKEKKTQITQSYSNFREMP
ncbi:MAG: hypothetical protein U0V70_00880 [Terriglobia bacterium]